MIPTRPPSPDWPPLNTWCSACGVHRATTTEPLCPVCLDDASKEEEQ